MPPAWHNGRRRPGSSVGRMRTTCFLWAALLALDGAAALSPERSFAVGLHAASRTAYVGFAALVLEPLSRRPLLDAAQAWDAFRRFRATASALMLQDALSFAALIVATRGTLGSGRTDLLLRATGLVLAVGGIALKAWAARSLRKGAYYWIDFFMPPETIEPCRRGPYRWLRHPMYTAGYAHLYGFALLGLSWPALLLAFFDQAAMLALNAAVEEPHLGRLYGRDASRGETTPT
jgi:protein-S-isoprenylcysteine O-methyltransferase Ste14